jgi:ribosomal protein S18 acetylase RimI-like enzyme
VITLGSAWAFERKLQDRCALRAAPFQHGTALFRPDLPRVYDENFLRVERGFEDLEAAELAAVADKLQGTAGLAHRKAVIPDESAGERMSDDFARLRWRRSVLLVMGLQGNAPSDPAHPVQKLPQVDLRSSRSVAFADDLGSGAANQVVGHLELVASTVATRAFAVFADGAPVSWCVLYEEGGIGQIDDVVTLPRHRRRGYARAVLQAAVRASLDAGNSSTFIVADDEDWPKEMYGQLGFEALGRRYEFTRP